MQIEHFLEGTGFLYLILPKFGSELNPTEHVWCQSKSLQTWLCNNIILYMYYVTKSGIMDCNHWGG